MKVESIAETFCNTFDLYKAIIGLKPDALLNLSSWCLVMVERLFLAVPRGCLQFVIVVFPDHTHLLFLVVLRVAVLHMFYCIVHIINL